MYRNIRCHIHFFFYFFISTYVPNTYCQTDPFLDYEAPHQYSHEFDELFKSHSQDDNGFDENLEVEDYEGDREKDEIDYYKELIKSKRTSNASFLTELAGAGQYIFSDLMIDSLLVPFYRFCLAWKDSYNHHLLDPVRKGKHYLRYMDSVMLGTFDNMLKENTGGKTPILNLWGIVFNNVISDFKLGSEVRSPGIIDSKYHNHPLLVKRLGAETGKVANRMVETHEHELVVIDVVKPFMLALDFIDDNRDNDPGETEDEMVVEYEITDENNIYGKSGEYERVDDYEDRKKYNQNIFKDSPVALIYKFFYATKKLVTGINHPVEFEETDYFKRTGRYEESDRTFLYQWNKTISKRNSFRSGQIVRVDRKGYFSMGLIPLAWNYCEVILHEGGTKNKKVLVQSHEKELIYDYREYRGWGIKRETITPIERIRTVRKKVVKQVPNVNKFRVYTENLCQAAEASVRSRSEVVVFATERTFSWLVPGLVFFGVPSISFFYKIMRPQDFNMYTPLVPLVVVGLAAWYYPSILISDVPDTIHTIKFPPPDDY